MFNLSGSEIVVILLLALVVLGPEKLPDALRRAGKTYAELKKMGSTFQAEVKGALDEPMKEMRETADLLRKSTRFDDDDATDADKPTPRPVPPTTARNRPTTTDTTTTATAPAPAPAPADGAVAVNSDAREQGHDDQALINRTLSGGIDTTPATPPSPPPTDDAADASTADEASTT